jgi:hypothetical protein
MSIIADEPAWPLKVLYPTVWNQGKETAKGDAQNELAAYTREVYHRLRSGKYTADIVNIFIECAQTLAFDDERHFLSANEWVPRKELTYQNRNRYFDEDTIAQIDRIIAGHVPFYADIQDFDADDAQMFLDVFYLLVTDESMQPVNVDQSLTELIQGIAGEKFALYVTQIEDLLQGMDKGSSPDDLHLDSAWEEFAYQFQEGESVDWEIYVDLVRGLCRNLLEDLPEPELRLLWTDINFCYDWESSHEPAPTDVLDKAMILGDLTDELYQRVCFEAEKYELHLYDDDDEDEEDSEDNEDDEDSAGEDDEDVGEEESKDGEDDVAEDAGSKDNSEASDEKN